MVDTGPAETPDVTGTPEAPTRITVSLSGGGYRATMFSAGALLAIADSELRTAVASVSSVSGGSIASAVTVGGFSDPSEDDPDPMGRRVRLLAGLTQTREIRSESLLNRAKFLITTVIAGLVIYLFLLPEWTEDDPPGFDAATAFLLAGALFVVLAFWHSWYAVQAVVETLVSEARGTSASPHGTALADIAQDEATQRIFCATDLSSGSHVYLAPGYVLAPGEVGRDPNVFLADVVAASACFPGLRPIVFRRAEVGLATATAAGRGRRHRDQVGLATAAAAEQPHRHRAGGRLLIGIAGIAGVAVAVVAVFIRILGPLDRGWIGLGIAVVLLAVGCAMAAFSARILWLRDDLVLVDGGVCDNLGAAFALLSRDDRYPDLPIIAGADSPGLMLVVDASKPFTELDVKGRRLGELVPLRLRGAQRSVLKLLGNANAAARKHVIQLLLGSGGPTTGAVVSIDKVPAPSDEKPDAIGSAEVAADWTAVVEMTKATPTTLDALDAQTVHNLLVQSYHLTHSTLAAHGVKLVRERSGTELIDLGGKPARAEIRKFLRNGRGPYARQANRVRLISTAFQLSLVAAFLYFALW